MKYADFFERVTGFPPFPYQDALAQRADWPTLLDVPTGLGKTAAAVVAWLWRRLEGHAATGRRLVFTLPTRVLVDQTREAVAAWCARAGPVFADRGRSAPSVHVLRGGDLDESWQADPARELILVGTQDMMLSRALNRGFAMSRSRWPMHFAFVNDDCFWVLDETQLMGVGVETSAQLQAFRTQMRTFGPTRTLWMSATLGREQLRTVDHPEPAEGWSVHSISEADRSHPRVSKRLSAVKTVRLDGPSLEGASKKHEASYLDELGRQIEEAHRGRGGLTLAILNSVRRAQALTLRLRRRDLRVSLIHSRFRSVDRAWQEAALSANGDRIIVATQAIEAGVDVSARTLFSELAPWPSLVQRLGRCNRYGEQEEALFICCPLDVAEDEKVARPYEPAELQRARELLEELNASADLRSIAEVSERYEPPKAIRPVLRRRDLLQLFDTTPDLMGSDIDVSRFIRDDQDTDVQFYWRELEGPPAPGEPRPGREEICSVSVGAANGFLDAAWKRRSGSKGSAPSAWAWDAVTGRWVIARSARPGQAVLLSTGAGGYDPALGFTGESRDQPMPAVATALEPDRSLTADLEESDDDQLDADPLTTLGVWVRLTDHLAHVEAEARAMATDLGLRDWVEVLGVAGRWHDVGKAHPEFQRRLLEPVADRPEAMPPATDEVWAKSGHRLQASPNRARPVFRHELASALAWLGAHPGHQHAPLIAYLVAAHHGKVRLSLRSAPHEPGPGDGRPFALGVWDGDSLFPVTLPSGEALTSEALRLEVMAIGENSWRERAIALVAKHGPFRLAMLETLVRAADWTASSKEQAGAYDE